MKKYEVLLRALFYFMPLLSILIPISCSKDVFTEESDHDLHPDENEKSEPVVYLTGVGFPEGYDWRKGNYGDVSSYLIVLKDGKKYLNLPIGKQFHLSPDPDMHRLCGGNLYADFSTGDETIFSKNGSELFRYEGRDMVAGFLVEGEDVYTLGLSREGTGITFRKNGHLLFEDPLGVSAGDLGESLYVDEGKMCFVYYRRIKSLPPECWPWYVYSDGKVEEIKIDPEVFRIYDAKMIQGKLCRVVSYKRNKLIPVLLWNDEVHSVCHSVSHAGISRCQILVSENQIYVKTRFGQGMDARVVLWNHLLKDVVYDDNLFVYDFYLEGEMGRFIVSSRNKVSVYDFEQQEKMIRGNYQLTSPNCASLNQERMRVALSPCDYKENPILWTDGRVDTLAFKGYVTSIVVEKFGTNLPKR